MENATKALLIAAAVLITIVIIALGIVIINNTADTSKQADETGEIISNATDEAIRSYQKLYITADEFNDFINNLSSKYKSSTDFIDALTIQNSKLRNQIEIKGFAYQDVETKLSTEPGYKTSTSSVKFSKEWLEYENYICNTFMPSLISSGRLKIVSNPKDPYNFIDALLEVYRANKDESATRETFINKTKTAIKYFYGTDSDGYINRVYMMGIIKRW